MEQEYKKKFDIQLWKKLVKYLMPFKKQFILLGVLMVFIGVVEATFPLMTRYAIDYFIGKNTVAGLEKFGMVFLLLVLIQVSNVRLMINVAGKINIGLCYDIRKRGFKRLQELTLSYFDRTPVGWIMARLMSDVQRVGDTMAWGIVDLVWGFAMMAAVLVYMLVLYWKLALVVMTVIPVLAVLSIKFQQKILEAYRKVRKTNSRITGAFNEGITGAKTTKILNTGGRNLNEFSELTDSMYKSSVSAAVYSSIYMPVVISLGSVGTALAIWAGGSDVTLQAISYGTLVAFISYTVQFFEPVREFARVLSDLIAAQASIERVVSLLEAEPEIKDGYDIEKKFGGLFHASKDKWPPITGNISFRNVSFSYRDGQDVLSDFNIDIKAGETIALVGETGSGKSTIVNLACRFYEPVGGEILIDGTNYRERSQLWLQSNLGYVLQTPHLFSGSVRDNIKYGRLDATGDEVIEAARLVNAHDFITNLEKGYDTEVGEGGSRLSTGQKQLVSLARAILADPKIFVLDEATSSVDTETEHIIQQAIQKLLKGRTSFIIAHRLSTIRSADRILVIHKGRLIEEGSHSRLLKLKGYYYRLYTNQFTEEKEELLLKA
ncbi:MAG: ABC transporter ATP-binding protein [Ruminiclostridium sp.]|nr:ABC transporter ATP-binding protein [Ruminiclostridium sp.]